MSPPRLSLPWSSLTTPFGRTAIDDEQYREEDEARAGRGDILVTRSPRAASFSCSERLDSGSHEWRGCDVREGGWNGGRHSLRVIMSCRLPDHRNGRPCLAVHRRPSLPVWASSLLPASHAPRAPEPDGLPAAVQDPRRTRGCRRSLALVLALATGQARPPRPGRHRGRLRCPALTGRTDAMPRPHRRRPPNQGQPAQPRHQEPSASPDTPALPPASATTRAAPAVRWPHSASCDQTGPTH